MKGAEAKVCWPFYAKYRKMENTLDESDVDDATTASASEGLSLAEMSWLWAFQARLAGIEGDRAPQLAALRRATAGSSQ